MEFKKYQQKAARTCVDLGSKELNNAHMIYGMVSELAELKEAINKKDITNTIEEIGDLFWFLVNYARLNNVENIDLRIPSLNEINPSLSEAIASLCNEEKREIAYKKEFSMENKGLILGDIFNGIIVTCIVHNILYVNCLEANIAKLQARYPKKFSEEKALNRDLEVERKILEN